MNITLQGPLTGLVVAGLGLWLLLAPINILAKRRALFASRRSGKSVPLWMHVFFRTLGLVLLVLGAILLWPLLSGSERPSW